MSDDTQNPLPKIRTFAADLEAARKKRSLKHSSETKTDPAEEDNTATAKPTSTPPKKVVIPKDIPGGAAKVTIPNNSDSKSKEVKTEIPKEIPAFHEVQKHQPKPTVPKPPVPTTPKVTSTPPVPAAPSKSSKPPVTATKIPLVPPPPKKITTSLPGKKLNIGYDSEVITDQKRKRFSLFGAIVASIKAWFTPKKKPKPAVPSVAKTENRKEVVQAATTKTAHTETLDPSALRARIKERTTVPPVVPTPPEPAPEVTPDEPETSWSPYTDTGYALLEEPDNEAAATPEVKLPQNVQMTFKNIHREPVPLEQEPAPAPAITKPTEPRVAPEPQPLPPIPKPTTAPVNTLAEETDEARWAAASEGLDVVSTPRNSKTNKLDLRGAVPLPPVKVKTDDVVIPKPEPERAKSTPVLERTPQAIHSDTLRRIDTNTLAIVFLLMIIGAAVVIVLSHISLNRTTAKQAVVQEAVSQIAPLVSKAQVQPITVTVSNLNQLEQEIKTLVVERGAGIHEMPLVSPTGDELSSAYIFSLLKLNTPPTLQKSIVNARIVSINQSKPLLLFKFLDENTVRGGFLTWEKNLVNDLKTLYDIPEHTAVSFTDEIYAGADLRVVRYEGTVEVAYTITDNNIAIIAASLADLEQVLKSIQGE